MGDKAAEELPMNLKKGGKLLLTGHWGCYLMMYLSSPLKWRRRHLLKGHVEELCLHKMGAHKEPLLKVFVEVSVLEDVFAEMGGLFKFWVL